MPLFSSGVVSHCASKNVSSQLCQAGRRKVAFSTTAAPTDEEEAESCSLSRLLSFALLLHLKGTLHVAAGHGDTRVALRSERPVG